MKAGRLRSASVRPCQDDGRDGWPGSGEGFGFGVDGSRRSGTGTFVGFGRRVGWRLGVRLG